MNGPTVKSLFQLGQIVATPGALAVTTPEQRYDLIHRHVRGDWGCVCDEDKEINEAALVYGNRVLSAYPVDPDKPAKGYGDNVIWIITEADRSVTTFLLPDEY